MFSPSIHAIRSKILNKVLDADPQQHPPNDKLDYSTDDTVEDMGGLSDDSETPQINLENTNEIILDPEKLPGADQAAYYDLEEFEQQLGIGISSSSEFNCLSLHFLSILNYLEKKHHTTQQLTYLTNMFQALAINVRSVQCIHPALVSQRNTLAWVAELELEALKQRVLDAFLLQADNKIELNGLRVIDPGPRHVRTFSSPLATSAMVLTAIIHCLMGVGREDCNFILAAIQGLLTLSAELQGDRSQQFMVEHI
ncbi:hypothetical protein FRC11_008323, partial [Ceratobasidium sp. 423]